MNKKRTRGFIDPLTIGFIIAITGTAAGLTYKGQTEEAQAMNIDSQAVKVVQTTNN